MATGDVYSTNVGVFRGELVDGDRGRGYVAGPDAVVPISESTREPVTAVSTKGRLADQRRLTHGGTREEEGPQGDTASLSHVLLVELLFLHKYLRFAR